MTNKTYKITFTRGGGRKGKQGGECCKITLPITKIRELGITPESNEVNVRFEDGKIIIEKLEKNV